MIELDRGRRGHLHALRVRLQRDPEPTAAHGDHVEVAHQQLCRRAKSRYVGCCLRLRAVRRKERRHLRFGQPGRLWLIRCRRAGEIRRRIYNRRPDVDRLIGRDVAVLDDVRDRDGAERHRESCGRVIDLEHTPHHPTGREEDLVDLDLARARRRRVDRPRHPVGRHRAHGVGAVLHDDDVGLIRDLVVARG